MGITVFNYRVFILIYFYIYENSVKEFMPNQAFFSRQLRADNIKIKRKASLFPVTQTHKELELRPKPQLEVSLHRGTNEQL